MTIRIEALRLVKMLMGKGLADAQQRRQKHDEDSLIIMLTEPVSLRRSGREMALLVGSTVAADRSDPTLVRLVAKAWALREALVSSDAPTFTAFAGANGFTQSYATRLIRIAWLAPDIIEAILDGRQPPDLNTTRLMRDTRLSTDWQEQRQALGFG
ncbi:MAG: hypothetical protein JWO26_3978 [Rhodospirillales bacterium]|nr:hypothetical protein [Rhodospirillales bacterium]MDB5384346.1 hypothetical protein [Rhodospirillales bacterium]